MRAIVINLADATERMAFQHQQLKALGLEYSRQDAFDERAATLRPASYWNTWERPLRDVEKACFLSHRHAWSQVAAGDEPVLVLEDDALLSDRTPDLLAALKTAEGIDFLTLETRARKKLLARNLCEQDRRLGVRRLYQDRTGAAAYILWPQGAKKLLHRTERRAGLADAVICAAYELAAFQADPALALQIDRSEAYGLKPPIVTRSAISTPRISSAEDLALATRLRFRIRRILSQLRMGLRLVANIPFAARREVKPDDESHFRHLSTHD